MTKEELNLPQVQVNFHRPLPEACHLLVLGGRPPATNWLQALLEQSPAPKLWAIDHGVDACRSASALPDVLLGDSDSAAPENWSWGVAHAAVTERHPPEKDLTDTQLALARAAEQAPAILLLTGAFGGRFDHAFSTVFSAAQQPGTCLLADDREILLFVRGGEQISIHSLQAPAAISLLPLTERVQGITLTGTHWPLVDASLIQAKPYAVSNVLAADANTIDVHIRQGILGVHLVFESASDTLHCPSKEHGEHRSSCRSLSVCDADEPPRKAQQQTIPQR